jgi:hypothetical protein
MWHWIWWLSLVIPATQEAEIEGSQFEVSLGKVLTRLYVKEQGGLGGTYLQSQILRRQRSEDWSKSERPYLNKTNESK